MTTGNPASPPDGGAIKRAFEGLPTTHPVEWTPFAKALIVQAVDWGWIMHEDALSRYGIRPEELRSWQSFIRH